MAEAAKIGMLLLDREPACFARHHRAATAHPHALAPGSTCWMNEVKHNQHNSATIMRYYRDSPPSPPPSPPPRPPQACDSFDMSNADCSLPALFCHAGDHVIFDESLAADGMDEYATAWTAKCGPNFWASDYDWAQLPNIVAVCVGATCVLPRPYRARPPPRHCVARLAPPLAPRPPTCL